MNQALTIPDAVRLFLESLDKIPTQLPLNIDNNFENSVVQHLRHIVPQQKVSPAHFDIVDDRIVISKTPSQPLDAATSISNAARSELACQGEVLVSQLSQTNCDKRLLENITKLHEQLSNKDDIVRLGIANLGCSMMCTAFENELPSAIAAQLKAYTVGISMYVGQFEEWHKFSDNASSLKLDNANIDTIQNSAEILIQALKSRPDLADPEVPKLISYIKRFIDSPSKSSVQAGFALLRTLENLIIRVYQYGTDFLDDFIVKSSKALASSGSKLAAAALLTIAVNGAVELMPVAVSIKGSEWIANATELVAKQISLIK